MKILIINARYYPDIHGGGDKSTQFLAEGLARSGHKVTVVSTSRTGEKENYRLNGVDIRKIRLWNMYWFPPSKPQSKIKKALWHLLDIYNPFMGFSLKKILIEEKPDLIHSQALDGFSVSAWEVAQKLSIPVIHTLRGYKLLCPNATMFKNGRNCENQCTLCAAFSFPQKIVSRHVNAVIGISDFVLNRHLSYDFFSRATVRKRIFNAYGRPAESGFHESEPRKSGVLKLGYFGRIHPTKGIEVAISALRTLGDNNTELYIAGDGDADYLESLKSKVKDLKVEFSGHVKPEDFFPRIDVLLVLSQWHEPLGRVVLESFSYGVPVIGSNRGGIPEMIEEGQNGFSIDPDNESQLIERIRKIQTGEKREEMRQKCLESSRRFLPEVIIAEHLELYGKVLSER
ncbi:MAG: glycosyltransferase family 4 protein [Spirochaetales bacterium]|nr:glycosyltransferase family 4 protein [Spirochaetales bacterium]